MSDERDDRVANVARQLQAFRDHPLDALTAVREDADLAAESIADLLVGAAAFATHNGVDPADVVAAFFAGITLGATHMARNVGPALLVLDVSDPAPSHRRPRRPGGRRHGR